MQQLVVVAQHVVVQTAIGEVERHRRLVDEGDAHGVGSPVIIVPVVSFGIVDEPRLLVEAVGEMVGDERQHVVVGRDDGEVGAVLGLLETDELFHTQLLVHHLAGDVGHGQDIRIGEVTLDALASFRLPEYFADVLKQRVIEFGQLRQPADRYHLDSLLRQPFLQPLPHAARLLRIGGNGIQPIAEQRHGVSLRQQHLRLLPPRKSVEHRGEKAVQGVVEGVAGHFLMVMGC